MYSVINNLEICDEQTYGMAGSVLVRRASVTCLCATKMLDSSWHLTERNFLANETFSQGFLGQRVFYEWSFERSESTVCEKGYTNNLKSVWYGCR